MIAEILAIGSEITHGAKLDTNSQWLSVELESRGFNVQFHSSVADDLAANLLALAIAADRADVLLITGGLGPTLDDLTRDALAQWAGVPLEFDPTALQQISAMFARRGRPMPERNHVQAMFPLGSVPLPNPVGTAPGVWLERSRPGRPPFLIAALPGVPSEMRRMFADQVGPRLPATGVIQRQRRIHCFGCGESQAEELLGDLTARGRAPEVGITAHDAVITLRATARGSTQAECDAQLDAAERSIRDRLGEFVFGDDEDELEMVVLRQLERRGETLAVFDQGTCGWLPAALAGLRSPAFRGAFTVPAAEVDPVLRLPELRNITTAHGAEADACGAPPPGSDSDAGRAAERACSCRIALAATYALAIGPLPATRSDDELAASSARVTIALAGPGGVETVDAPVGGNPAILSARLGKTAIDLLRRRLPRS